MEVVFFSTEDGAEPAREYLDSLDIKMRAKVVRAIELLQNNGEKLREPHSKHIRDGVFELRVKFSSDISRTLYFFFDGGTAVLTNGFIKKTNRTPPREFDRAKRYRNEYIMRRRK